MGPTSACINAGENGRRKNEGAPVMPAPFALSRITSPATRRTDSEARVRDKRHPLGLRGVCSPNFLAAALSAVFSSDSFTVFSKVEAATATWIDEARA